MGDAVLFSIEINTMKKLLPFALLLLVIGCGTGSRISTAPTSGTPFGIDRRVKVGQTKTFNRLEITIQEVYFKQNFAFVDMKIVNTGKNPLAFYPNQKSVVVGKHQLDAIFLNNGTEVSGEFQPGVERTGTVGFEDKSKQADFKSANQIDLRFGDVIDTKIYKSEEVNWTIELK